MYSTRTPPPPKKENPNATKDAIEPIILLFFLNYTLVYLTCFCLQQPPQNLGAFYTGLGAFATNRVTKDTLSIDVSADVGLRL